MVDLSSYSILFLGSSVTRGEFSGQESFVEYLFEKYHFKYTKEAVSGTTLMDNGPTSYISRLLTIPKENRYDLFICQLSTNDAYLKIPLGEITNGHFDTQTVTGAIQFIVDYVQSTFHCPVMFYTGSYYDCPEYEAMVNQLNKIAQEMNFFVIDMFSDKDFNAISKDDYNHYMRDPVHPNKLGYYTWWGPYMDDQIQKALEK